MEITYTFGDLKRVIQESTNEFKPKMGTNVIRDNAKNNVKAVKDIEKEVKEYDGGLTNEIDDKKVNTPEDVDYNRTTLDAEFAEMEAEAATEMEEAVEAETFTAEEAADKAKAFLQEVLEKMGLTVMIEKMIKTDKVVLHIHGNNLGLLIGKHGQTLDALQYLTNLTANRGQENRHFIMLDVENYRKRREETLKQLAVRLAGRIKHSNDKVVLEPMNGYERKIIHVALQNVPHVRTESEGQDPYRHVVIYYD